MSTIVADHTFWLSRRSGRIEYVLWIGGFHRDTVRTSVYRRRGRDNGLPTLVAHLIKISGAFRSLIYEAMISNINCFIQEGFVSNRTL